MANYFAVLADLRAESAALDDLVAPLTPEQWRLPTPAAGWTIAHQIGHLAWTDSVSLTAATDASAFAAMLEKIDATTTNPIDDAAAEAAGRGPADLLVDWRIGRDALQDALSAAPVGTKLPWFGPPMMPTSMATARIMETWAHGQDIADTLGVERPVTDRLLNVAHIGVRTRDFAFAIRGMTPPRERWFVELTSPSGELWAWGPKDATQRVAGTALDFCLLVTQRRHRDDLHLTATGADADAWLDIAQAFAGEPGPGRAKA